MKDIKALCDQVRQTAYAIHVYHAHGHLEKVYENALAHRLRKLGMVVDQQRPIQVFDEDGTLIGGYSADLLVEGCLIVELKTAKALAPEHEAQILGYLKSSRLTNGLLINFGSYKFEIRKFVWTEGNRKEHKDLKNLSADPSLRALCSLRLIPLFLHGPEIPIAQLHRVAGPYPI